PRCRAPVPKAPPVEAAEAIDSERVGLDGGDTELVLTAQLAARLLRELLEAFRKSTSVEEARASVGAHWGFPSSAAMTQCIEAQANATMTLRDALGTADKVPPNSGLPFKDEGYEGIRSANVNFGVPIVWHSICARLHSV
ncbi:unnamed protein product, partial [Symbiodinium microadriaticum]